MDPAQGEERTAALSNKAQQWVCQSRAREKSQRNRLGLQWHDASFPSYPTLFRIKVSWWDERDRKIVTPQKRETLHPIKTCVNRQAEMQKGQDTSCTTNGVKVKCCDTLVTTAGMKYRTWRRMLLKSKDVRFSAGRGWASEQLPVGSGLLRRLSTLTISTQLPLSCIQRLLDSQCNQQAQLSFRQEKRLDGE